MKRFTLQPGRWHAMETLLPGGERWSSPVWVSAVRPRQTGKGVLEIDFYHANYPEGVRDKTYRLTVLRRTVAWLLAEDDAGASDELRIHLFLPLSMTWIGHHFPNLAATLRAAGESDIETALDRATGRTNHARECS